MRTKFIVLTTNRSGSVWLMSRLNDLPKVTAQGELFLPRNRSAEKRWDSDFAIPRYFETRHNNFSIRPFSVFTYLDRLYNSSEIVGFKLMYRQLGSYPEILLYLIRHRVMVVHLVRRNHLDVLVSYAIKAHIGKAHLLSEQPAPNDIQIDLNTENLIPRMERLGRKQSLARKMLKWFRLRHIEVAYEDLVKDQKEFQKIREFLSVQAGDEFGNSKVVKIRKGGHRDVIRNYDEVFQKLENSKYSVLID